MGDAGLAVYSAFVKLTPEHVRRAERAQEELTPKEDLRAYAGQWVAIRRGRVVTSRPDPKELLDDPRVRPGDGLICVPERLDLPLIL